MREKIKYMKLTELPQMLKIKTRSVVRNNGKIGQKEMRKLLEEMILRFFDFIQ